MVMKQNDIIAKLGGAPALGAGVRNESTDAIAALVSGSSSVVPGEKSREGRRGMSVSNFNHGGWGEMTLGSVDEGKGAGSEAGSFVEERGGEKTGAAAAAFEFSQPEALPPR